ncbi:phage collar protein [Limnobaculum eriocheiris]|uniref:phage collar protein n=1 Tax=Limnobaculum eriocheiris TaxID=2897391 RepID=UPI003B84A100
MLVPGGNLLKSARRVIRFQTVNHYAFAGTLTNEAGLKVTQYSSPAPMKGSFQPVPRALYEQLGLNLQKSYWNFYVPGEVLDIDRDVSGDQIEFNNVRYQCQSITEWGVIDGWNAVLCIRCS